MAVYLEIASQLRKEIKDQYAIGELLPSEKVLAQRFEVNRHTLRRAVDELVHDGLIRRYQGLGNQIVKKPIPYALHDKACFTYNLSQIGLALDTEVMSRQQKTIEGELAERLQIPQGSQALVIQTCRYIDKEPACIIRHHLFGVSPLGMAGFGTGSLHKYLREHYGYQARRGHTSLRARMPASEECHHLGISRGTPLMEVHTRNYLDAYLSAATKAGHTPALQLGELLEYSVSISRSDMFDYSVDP